MPPEVNDITLKRSLDIRFSASIYHILNKIMNYRVITLHSLALTLLNLLTIFVGSGWDSWTHRAHPFGAQLPVGTLLCITGFFVWYHSGLVFLSEKLMMRFLWEWCQMYVITLVLGPLLFVSFYYVNSSHGFSFGRLFVFSAFQGTINFLVIACVYPIRFTTRSQLKALLQKEWIARIMAFCFGCFVSLLLVAFLEGGFYLLNQRRPSAPKKEYVGGYLQPGNFFQYDKLLGIKAKPDVNVSCKLKINNKIIWDVNYSTDQFGRRSSPVVQPEKVEDFAVFFGGSFLFGEGSNDYETIPSIFGKEVSHYRPYNYGFPGYGPQQMYAKLKSKTLKNEISENRGILIYIYLEDVHEARAVGDMVSVNAWARNFPCYEIDSAGNLLHKGSFRTARPILYQLYRILGKSQIVRYFGLNFPPKLSDRHYRLTVRIIEESKKLFMSQFHNGAFYVVLYPKRSPHKKIVPYLKQAGINYLDYFDLFDPHKDSYSYKGDGHPTPMANRVIAERLSIDVEDLLE